MSNLAIDIRKVTFSYGNLKVIDELSLEVPRGSVSDCWEQMGLERPH
jgi:ABC-type transporter Mla maintaining outer membrane lipid asymmetry ATPase subunit MlaF